MARDDLPSGTVTLLFTDVERSTALLDELGPDRYAQALADHRRVVRAAVGAHGGVEVDTQGDALFIVFRSAIQALAGARAAQEALADGPLRVRMGLHTGTPVVTEEGYVGLDVHLGARISAAGHGGQVILSQDTRELVEEELLDLGEHRLKDISHPVRVFQLGSTQFPPLRTISTSNLPHPASSFVGRGQEIEQVLSLVRSGARLVALTGPGGSGKTRLAIEAASELLADFKAGVFWVGLATVRDATLVSTTIAQTLGAKGDLAEHIGTREILLLLDNFEQVVEAAPTLVALLEACPSLAMIVTSRELLRVRGEVEYAVPPLPELEAIELFCVRSRLGFDDTIADVCRGLDNLPLAIELAAARTSVLSPGQILERLSGRLDLLRGGRDAESRQQTLRATIQWSHELLQPDEQQLFARLAVFVGGATLTAAGRVCNAGLNTLQSLVDKSLVRHSEERFWMLETIRDYATERLDQSDDAEDTRRRHAEFFRGLCESANLRNDSDGEQRHDLVHAELDNIRSALDWCASSDPELGLHIAVALENFWATNSPTEGRGRLTELLGRAPDLPPGLLGVALRCRGSATTITGDFDAGKRDYERALVELRDAGDEIGVGTVLFRLAVEAARSADRDQARSLLDEGLSLHRGRFKKGEAQILTLLGDLAFEEGRHEEALRLLERSRELCRETGFRWWLNNVLQSIAEFTLELGRPDDALAPACEALSLGQAIGDRQGVVFSLALLARQATETENRERAGRLWGAIEAEEARAGHVGVWEGMRAEYERRVSSPGDADFERGRDEGRKLSLDEAIEHALSIEPSAARDGETRSDTIATRCSVSRHS